jgi:hypothetical protein
MYDDGAFGIMTFSEALHLEPRLGWGVVVV